MTQENFDHVQQKLTLADNWEKLTVAQIYLHEQELDLTTDEWWELFINAWTSAEHNSTGLNLGACMEMLNSAPDKAPPQHRQQIPDKPFKIYRGGDAHGLSWSKWKKKAVFFQKRKMIKNPIHNPVPAFTLPPLEEKTVHPDEVFFFYDGRSEKEIVIIPDEAWDYIETDAYKRECEEFTQRMEAVAKRQKQQQIQVFKMMMEAEGFEGTVEEFVAAKGIPEELLKSG
jgi:hypothetical protein